MKKETNWKYILLYSSLISAIVGAIVAGGIDLYIYRIASQESQIEERMIREVIEREAVLVLDGRIDEVVLLFDEKAFVRDAAGGNEDLEVIWNGKNMIAERYRNLPEFIYLKHEAIEITVSLDKTYARAIADTIRVYRLNGTQAEITSNQGEKWTFRKINGGWKITGFTYNLP